MALSIQSFRSIEVGLSFLLIVSLGLNVVLLERPVRALAGRSSKSFFTGKVSVKSSLPLINGELANLDFSSSPLSIVYLVEPSCGWCQKNKESFEALVLLLQGTKVRVYACSRNRNELSRVLPLQYAAIQVFDDSSGVVSKALGIGRDTPTTLLIASDGTVMGRWAGAYIGKTKALIEEALAIKLDSASTPTFGIGQE